MDCNATLETINQNIDQARQRQDELRKIMEAAEAAGLYYHAPRQKWENRGSGRYLYLHFHSDGRGGYTGPDGKRKVYVGNDPDVVAEHMAMIQRGAQYRDARREVDHLSAHISTIKNELSIINSHLRNLQRRSYL